MRVGVLITLDSNTNIREKFSELKAMGLCSCQLVCWERSVLNSDCFAETIINAQNEYGVDVTAFWCGWEGRCVWDFYDGQITLGLVPPDMRADRLAMLKEGSDFAKKIGVYYMATHVGFMPENPYDPNYAEVIETCVEIAGYCKANGQKFLFETGQETPLTLKRAIQDIEKTLGENTVGINLDPANLILYGKGNPVDALDVFGEHVCGIHGKDAVYSSNGYTLGEEVVLGTGKVNYPKFINKLKDIGYNGDITIEREISGEEQKRDILLAKELLVTLINE